jgi:hypothetical protein
LSRLLVISHCSLIASPPGPICSAWPDFSFASGDAVGGYNLRHLLARSALRRSLACSARRPSGARSMTIRTRDNPYNASFAFYFIH